MKFLTATLLVHGLALASAQKSSLRSPRKLQEVKAPSCTVLLREDLLINPGSGKDDHAFECEMEAEDMHGVPNLSLPIKASDAQMKKLKALFKSSGHVSGESSLRIIGAVKNDAEIFLPPGLEIALEKKPKQNNKRNLAVVTGDKPILVVKVTDSTGLARAESPAQIGDDVFGTNGDPVNLKSQLYGCSMGKLTVTEGDLSLPNGVPNGKGVAPGVMEVTISVSLEGNSRSTIRNAVTTAVQNAIGESLPGRYQQVMYVLQGCYLDCGWAAYAYINSWNSVYQGSYYKMTGVQVHELGHNFNLAHSGGLNGATYTDHTGMMGNPLYSDDVGKMCYNAAKNWQIGWYNDRKLLLNPLVEQTKTVTLVGIADYLNNPDQHPVVVKVETGAANDFFVGFNRAIGVNSQNDEGDEVVTVVQVDGNNGEGYSQSYLKAKLGFSGDITGSSYSISNFGGSGEVLTISAVSINLATNPATATVQFQLGSGTSAPTSNPTSSPTASPVVATSSPTRSPVAATSSPTRNPTASPTISPTRSPVVATNSPTVTPTKFDSCTLNRKAKNCKNAGCLWLGGGICVSSGEGPTPTPPSPSPPSPTPPTGGTCSINSCSSCSGGGQCKSAGCSWSKGFCS